MRMKCKCVRCWSSRIQMRYACLVLHPTSRLCRTVFDAYALLLLFRRRWWMTVPSVSSLQEGNLCEESARMNLKSIESRFWRLGTLNSHCQDDVCGVMVMSGAELVSHAIWYLGIPLVFRNMRDRIEWRQHNSNPLALNSSYSSIYLSTLYVSSLERVDCWLTLSTILTWEIHR